MLSGLVDGVRGDARRKRPAALVAQANSRRLRERKGADVGGGPARGADVLPSAVSASRAFSTSDFGGYVAAGRQRERCRRIARRAGHDVEHEGFWITISSLASQCAMHGKECRSTDERTRCDEEVCSSDG